MGMTMTLTAGDPNATTATILDGTGTDPWKLISADFGNPSWATSYSGPRGTQGARAAASAPENRTVQLLFRQSNTTFTNAATRASQLAECLEAVRRYGGRLTVRHSNQSYRHHFRILAGTMNAGSWSNSAERGRVTASMTFVCAPYAEGDSMGITDTFTATTPTTNFEAWSGSVNDWSITSRQLKCSVTAQDRYLAHTSTGFRYGDVQATVRVVPAVSAGHGGGVMLKGSTPGTHIGIYAYDNPGAGTSNLWIDRWISGASVNLITSAAFATRITAGLPYHVTGRIEGNVLYAEYWAPGTVPSLAGTATHSTSFTLTGSDLATFGEAASGFAGVYIFAASANDAIELLDIAPYTYRGANLGGPVTLPGQVRLNGAIPGDAPATCTVDVGVAADGANTTAFGMVGWAQRPATWNRVPDPGFEWTPGGVARQWGVAAVAGVTGAATSITSVTGGRFGINAASIVCPATANTGVTCELIPPGGFRPGVTYTAELWVRSAAGTTNSRLRLGVSGDIASETASALSSGWVRRTVTWTPTARRTLAYLCFEITAATATTFIIDGASVYEGTTAPTLASQREGNSGIPPFGVIEAQSATAITGYATASGAAYLNSRYLNWTAGLTATAEWVVDPALIPRDMHSDSVDVEVWAAIENGATTLACVTSAQAFTNTGQNTVYTREYGSTGRTDIPVVRGLARLGTLPLVPVGGVAVPQRIVTSWSCSVIGTGVQLAYLLLVIPSQRQASPTGKSTTNYPTFANTGTGRPITRRLQADGTGLAAGTLSGVWSQGPSLIGPLLEPDGTNVDFMAAVARFIPDTSVGTITAQFRNGGISIIPTPRWHVVRDV